MKKETSEARLVRLGREWAEAAYARGESPTHYGNRIHDTAAAERYKQLSGFYPSWFVIGAVGKTATRPLDIGAGYTVVRYGYDVNGNQCVWVRSQGARAKKIQTNGNLPAVQARGGEITARGAAEIKAYYARYCATRR